MPDFGYTDYVPNNYLTDELINAFSWQYSTLTTYTTNTTMPNTTPVLENSETTPSPLSIRRMMEERMNTPSNGPAMPEPQDFSSAAEYDRAMRRYISRNGIPEEKQIIKERNVNTLKDLFSFIKYVKEQLKDNVNKNTPEELNFIEKMLSEEKMAEIVDNYLC